MGEMADILIQEGIDSILLGEDEWEEYREEDDEYNYLSDED